MTTYGKKNEREDFAEVAEACDNTIAIAERCNIKLDLKKRHSPRFKPPDGSTPEEFLTKLSYENAKRIYGEVTGEIKADALGVIELDVWIHAVVTWDGATMLVYKNGDVAGTMAKPGSSVAADSTVGMAIGNQPDGAENRPFDGIIDDVAIWNRALGQEEIAEMMNNSIPYAVEPVAKLSTTWGMIKY